LGITTATAATTATPLRASIGSNTSFSAFIMNMGKTFTPIVNGRMNESDVRKRGVGFAKSSESLGRAKNEGLGY
jgi:hypothetical protein